MSAHNLLQQSLQADHSIADPGDAGRIDVDRDNADVSLRTGVAETRLLSDPPKAGITLALSFTTDGGDCVVTADSAVNVNGDNTITFDAAGEILVLRSIQVAAAYVWRVVANDGAALSTV